MSSNGPTVKLFPIGLMENSFYSHPDPSPEVSHGMRHIDNPKLFWKHESLNPGKLKVSTNFEECENGNKLDNKYDFAYLYFTPLSKKTAEKNWDDDQIRKVVKILETWEPILKLPKGYQKFAIMLGGRVYAGVEFGSFEQLVLASKWFLSTFPTDDVLERLSANPDWWNMVGKKHVYDLEHIYSGFFTSKSTLTDYEKYRGQCGIPDALIDQMTNSIAMHIELEADFRKLCHPTNYGYICSGFKHFLTAIVEEQKIFESGALKGGIFGPKEGFQKSRQKTIGFIYASPGAFIHDPTVAEYVNLDDSVFTSISWYIAQYNDVLGFARDKPDKEYCPTSQTNYFISKGDETLCAMRKVLNEANQLRHHVIGIVEQMIPEKRVHFERMMLVGDKYIDYHFFMGVNSLNNRYGWVPVVE